MAIRKRIISIILTMTLALTMGGFTAFAGTSTVQAASTASKYIIKVNKARNVATVYQKTNGRYVPIRAMLTSCGKTGYSTPSGTFRMGFKNRWRKIGGPSMGGYCYGQYVCQITGGYLFHSVWYTTKNKKTQPAAQFNVLGKNASHGCVRLSCIDAKWVYDHCKSGTKIVIYSSSKSGPLGRPKKVYSNGGWDPTDPTNPHFKLKPTIIISKKKDKTVEYKSSYSLLGYVKAINKYACENITSELKIIAIRIWKNSAWTGSDFRTGSKLKTNQLGKYRITYHVKDKYCGKAKKNFYLSIRDTAKPIITAANRTVPVDSINAVSGVSAKQVSGASRTSAIMVYIKAPGAAKYKSMRYDEAKTYVFSEEGNYSVKYTAKSKYAPYKAATPKIITISAWKDAEISTSIDLTNSEANAVTDNDSLIKVLQSKIKVIDKGSKVTSPAITIAGTWTRIVNGDIVTVSYKGANGRTVTQQITVNVATE